MRLISTPLDLELYRYKLMFTGPVVSTSPGIIDFFNRMVEVIIIHFSNTVVYSCPKSHSLQAPQ